MVTLALALVIVTTPNIDCCIISFIIACYNHPLMHYLLHNCQLLLTFHDNIIERMSFSSPTNYTMKIIIKLLPHSPLQDVPIIIILKTCNWCMIVENNPLKLLAQRHTFLKYTWKAWGSKLLFGNLTIAICLHGHFMRWIIMKL
jgi:hypothetical protein